MSTHLDISLTHFWTIWIHTSQHPSAFWLYHGLIDLYFNLELREFPPYS